MNSDLSCVNVDPYNIIGSSSCQNGVSSRQNVGVVNEVVRTERQLAKLDTVPSINTSIQARNDTLFTTLQNTHRKGLIGAWCY